MSCDRRKNRTDLPGGVTVGMTQTRGSVARGTLTRTTNVSQRAVGTVRGNRCGPAVGLYQEVYHVLSGDLSSLF